MSRDSVDPRASEALDGLRGVAALMVVASHASLLGLHWIPGLSLAGIGKVGVYLFFVLSAFLLTGQWLASGAARSPDLRYVGGYLLKRFARIYPLYAVVLVIGWLLPPRGLGVPLDGAAVWRHLALVEGRDIYWSVPVEFAYYLVLPFVACWLAAPMGRAWRMAGVVAIGALAMALWRPSLATETSIALPFYLPVFLCGSVLAWWVFERRNDPVARASPIAEVLVLLLLVLTVPSVFALMVPGAPVDALHRVFLAWGVFWSAVVWGIVTGRLPGWAALLRWRGLRACGRWSFGIYLLHMPALYLVHRLPVPVAVQGLVGLAIALAVASIAHGLVERPVMRWAARAASARLAWAHGH